VGPQNARFLYRSGHGSRRNDRDEAGVRRTGPEFDRRLPRLSQVGFLDAAGVEEMTSLDKRLRGRSLKFGIVNANEQPLRFLRKLMLEKLAGGDGRRALS
jgi:hypothetical protein